MRAEAENVQVQLLDFVSKEEEVANATIDRFYAAIKYCTDQGVNFDDNHAKRMLLARPNERYKFLEWNHPFALAAAKPTMVILKPQMRDIDRDHKTRHGSTR